MPRAQEAQERRVSILHNASQDERYAAGAGSAGAACVKLAQWLWMNGISRMSTWTRCGRETVERVPWGMCGAIVSNLHSVPPLARPPR